jgi:hypothetical protein
MLRTWVRVSRHEEKSKAAKEEAGSMSGLRNRGWKRSLLSFLCSTIMIPCDSVRGQQADHLPRPPESKQQYELTSHDLEQPVSTLGQLLAASHHDSTYLLPRSVAFAGTTAYPKSGSKRSQDRGIRSSLRNVSLAVCCPADASDQFLVSEFGSTDECSLRPRPTSPIAPPVR